MTIQLKTEDDSHCFICGRRCDRSHYSHWLGNPDSTALVVESADAKITIKLCSEDWRTMTGRYLGGVYFGAAPLPPTYKQVMAAYRAHPRQKYKLEKLYDKVYSLQDRLDNADEEKEKAASNATFLKQAEGQTLTTKPPRCCEGWWFMLSAAIIAVAVLAIALIIGP